MSHCVGNFSNLMGKYKGERFLVLGSGATVKHYKREILDLIGKQRLVVIGINNMTHIYVPDIHLWTNNGRLEQFGSCINEKSIVLFGVGIKAWNMPNVDYYNVFYDDRAFNGAYYVPHTRKTMGENYIMGSFRQAGNLALYLAHLLGAKDIYYAGVDGYSRPFRGDHHCYGKGNTDGGLWEQHWSKDAMIYKCLEQIAKVVDFKIITPTLFKDFYDESILANNTEH